MRQTELIDIEATLIHETQPDDPSAGAYLLDAGLPGGTHVWVPKSVVERDGNTFTMPRRLAEEKGLV